MKSEKFILGIFLVLSIFLLSSVIVSAQNTTTQCDNDDICELGETTTCGDCNFASGWSCNHNDVCESGEPNRECDDCNNDFILPVTEEVIKGKGFRYAYWQCYSGEEEKQGSESSCKLSETWQSYAKEFCQDECYKDGSKCGVNSFSVAEECYLDVAEESFIPSVIEEEKIQEGKLTETKEEILVCKDSCPLDEKCYPFGYRKADKFCSDTGSFVEQLKSENSCDNNFECSSNLCIDSKCVSEGFLQKVMSWFKNLFG